MDAETRELLSRSSKLMDEMLNICVHLIALRDIKMQDEKEAIRQEMLLDALHEKNSP